MEKRYSLRLCFDKKTSEVKQLEYSVRKAFEDLEMRAQQIARKKERAAGIPEGVEMSDVCLSHSANCLYTEGNDFDKIYDKLKKASDALGVKI